MAAEARWLSKCVVCADIKTLVCLQTMCEVIPGTNVIKPEYEKKYAEYDKKYAEYETRNMQNMKKICRI